MKRRVPAMPLQLILNERMFCSVCATYDYFDEVDLNIEMCFMVAADDLDDLLFFVRVEGPFQALCYLSAKRYLMEQLFLEGLHIEKSVEGIKVKLYGRALDVTCVDAHRREEKTA